jgi:Protein of unknown function (DUF2934)
MKAGSRKAAREASLAAAAAAGGEVWEARVRERAYAIREREGRPGGVAERHWRLAEAELRQPAPPRPAPGELDMTVMGNILP